MEAVLFRGLFVKIKTCIVEKNVRFFAAFVLLLAGAALRTGGGERLQRRWKDGAAFE